MKTRAFMNRNEAAERMIVLCGPSGAGKSTLCARLLSERPRCAMSRSYTTRIPRGNERNGVEYDFVGAEVFEAMIHNGEFAEHACVHGNYYGTTHKAIAECLENERDVVFDIDVQGARNLKKMYPGLWCVLIVPPSFKVLEERLRARNTDSDEIIVKRLKKASEEIRQEGLFDFVIFNDSVDEAARNLIRIYDTLALRIRRRKAVLDAQGF